MSLREELQDWVPMYLWEKIEHPEGYVVSNEEYNARWNLTQVQGDQQANAIRDIIAILFSTVLDEENGASHITVTIPGYPNIKNVKEMLEYTITALTLHKTSGDHDGRYYTKEELLPWLRGGDTDIKEEVFVIATSNNGDGTFTYEKDGQTITGVLGANGEQYFELEEGYYEVGKNRLAVTIDDTLRRSAKSGGLIESSITSFALSPPEGAGTEVSALYYERIGISADYNIKVSKTKPPHNQGKTMWFRIME